MSQKPRTIIEKVWDSHVVSTREVQQKIAALAAAA